MNIGEVAERTGLSAKMIRHYEKQGLFNPQRNAQSGYRVFNETDVAQLSFIASARQLGFSLKQIGQLVSLWRDPHRASREVKVVAQQHLLEVEQQLVALQQMRRTLHELIAACPGSDDPHCSILASLQAADED
ncbi:Cu(I)-responsive transcriptional regulator [Idiomarina xiamenensis]|uniref:MerR family transcriptional regulator n=1 Tax=Idiomarina xiamenensis 10-D-4 TaxID=740709 RepID=K2LB26_9GAMM|nr:Cu(I)-responsive transcriptional regulator [Idiomarina xiamenensis]EKE87015.1 MerR family transcriptional regulator [Idiomarina xiamenensis 10-D-4]